MELIFSSSVSVFWVFLKVGKLCVALGRRQNAKGRDRHGS